MKLSVITTLYHSEQFVSEFYRRMVTTVKGITDDYEMIFVDDGSPDRSAEAVLSLQAADPAVTLIELSRNFGHHRALLTGLKMSKGDHVFMIDSDLEEDPELLALFWETLKTGPPTDAIFGVQQKRKGSWFEKTSGKLYYSLFSVISKSKYPYNTITARLMTRNYLDGLLHFEEKEADLWGLFVLNGFREKSLPVLKSNKGKSTYNLRRKIGMGIDTVTTLTHRPLYMIGLAGVIISTLAIAFGIFLLIRYLNTGWLGTSSVLFGSIWLAAGLILTALGVISVYLGKMFLEVKHRPTTIIRKIHRKHEADQAN